MMRAFDVAVEKNYIAEICQQEQAAGKVSSDKKIRMELTLLGVTFSVVDWIYMKSYDSTCGLASRSMKPSKDDAVIVKALRDHLLATPLFRSSVN